MIIQSKKLFSSEEFHFPKSYCIVLDAHWPHSFSQLSLFIAELAAMFAHLDIQRYMSSLNASPYTLSYFGFYFCQTFSVPILFLGFYCPLGSACPQACEAGSYCNQTGLHAPRGLCPAGYHCPRGSTDPHATPCPTGHYCPQGSPVPLPCPPGAMKSKTLTCSYTIALIIVSTVGGVIWSVILC